MADAVADMKLALSVANVLGLLSFSMVAFVISLRPAAQLVRAKRPHLILFLLSTTAVVLAVVAATWLEIAGHRLGSVLSQGDLGAIDRVAAELTTQINRADHIAFYGITPHVAIENATTAPGVHFTLTSQNWARIIIIVVSGVGLGLRLAWWRSRSTWPRTFGAGAWLLATLLVGGTLWWNHQVGIAAGSAQLSQALAEAKAK